MQYEIVNFTPPVVHPVDLSNVNLGLRYEEIKEGFTKLIDSVSNVVVTEEFLADSAKVQIEVNKLYKEIEEMRIAYKNLVLSTFYSPIADKLEAEIKAKFQEWERGFKARKTEVENQILLNRFEEMREWFDGQKPFEWLTLETAMSYGNVKITRKNKDTDIFKACAVFFDKVKTDITVLQDGYGAEEVAEYQKCFNIAHAVATVKARKTSIASIVKTDTDVIEETEVMIRNWELRGTRAQLTQIAKFIKEIGANYNVRQ